MNVAISGRKALLLAGAVAFAAPTALTAQTQEMPAQMDAQMDDPSAQYMTTVTGTLPTDLSELPDGPEIDGFISARKGAMMQVTGVGGVQTVVMVSQGTEIKSSGGFLGLSRTALESDSLLNGLPVTVKTKQWGDGYIASRIDLKSKDLKTAAMIANGTEQGFAEQTAATEALRGRVADIDNYNVKGTTNVYFESGKYSLSADSRAQLCSAAQQANGMDNALLLVVGYTDSTGTYEVNQELSEKRATRVVNFLQQECGWKPYRMLTPTGMATADPAADNSTEYGKAQNRRVAVNILVSKAVDGI